MSGAVELVWRVERERFFFSVFKVVVTLINNNQTANTRNFVPRSLCEKHNIDGGLYEKCASILSMRSFVFFFVKFQ